MDRHTDVYTCRSEELKCKGRKKVEQSDKPGLHLCRFKAQSCPSLDQGIASTKSRRPGVCPTQRSWGSFCPGRFEPEQHGCFSGRGWCRRRADMRATGSSQPKYGEPGSQAPTSAERARSEEGRLSFPKALHVF